MELQFNQTACPYLRPAVWELQLQEETQELRLPDGMPDAGTVLGSWGQTVLRSKEWRGDEMMVSGGVMVWLLYQPEDGSQPQKLETWIPFQLRWNLPQTQHEGIMRIKPALKTVDARLLSARKMMVRAAVCALGEAWEPVEALLAEPAQEMPGLELLTRTYPLQLPKEAGEKTFLIDEEWSPPSSAPAVAQILRYAVDTELQDQKVIGERLVFRGTAVVHVLYCGEDGRFHAWDFETPFSQYTELSHDYEQNARADTVLAVTSMELDIEENGTLHIKCGMVAQYLIEDRTVVKLVEDAYAPHRDVQLRMDTLQLPAVLDVHQEHIRSEQSIPVDCTQIVDASFLPEPPRAYMTGEGAGVELSGMFQVLYYDDRGELQCAQTRWSQPWKLPVSPAVSVQLSMQPGSKAQASMTGSDILMKGDMHLQLRTMSGSALPMVTAVEVGEAVTPDPNRPSLILCRAGEGDIWGLAKRCGSTVSAIRQVNDLQNEPEAGRLLLIPVT